MAWLKPPRVPNKPVPVFAAGDLSRLERACAGRVFAERRDVALIAVFQATGIRLSELTGIRYDADDPGRSDVDLWHREISVQGKGRKIRVVKISFDAARSSAVSGDAEPRRRTGIDLVSRSAIGALPIVPLLHWSVRLCLQDLWDG